MAITYYVYVCLHYALELVKGQPRVSQELPKVPHRTPKIIAFRAKALIVLVIAGDQLKRELSLPWENIGMWSILHVRSVRNLFWVTGTMRKMAWLIATFITINFLAHSAITAMVL